MEMEVAADEGNEDETEGLAACSQILSAAIDEAEAKVVRANTLVRHRREVVPLATNLVAQASKFSAEAPTHFEQTSQMLSLQQHERARAMRRLRRDVIDVREAATRRNKHLPPINVHLTTSGRPTLHSNAKMSDHAWKSDHARNAPFGPLVKLAGPPSPPPHPSKSPPLRAKGVARFHHADLRPVASRRPPVPLASPPPHARRHPLLEAAESAASIAGPPLADGTGPLPSRAATTSSATSSTLHRRDASPLAPVHLDSHSMPNLFPRERRDWRTASFHLSTASVPASPTASWEQHDAPHTALPGPRSSVRPVHTPV